MQIVISRSHRSASKLSVAALRLIILCLVGLFSSQTAQAHPMGNFSINHYTRLEARSDQVAVRYLLDFAEIPALDERSMMDLNHDNEITEPERQEYLRKRAVAFRANLQLSINGKPAALEMHPVKLEFRPGAGGLDTMREIYEFSAPLPAHAAGTSFQIDYTDTNFPQRTGWKEIIAVAGPGAILTRASVSAKDRSKELTEYRIDPNIVPPQQTQASFTMITGIAGTTAAAMPASSTATTTTTTNQNTPQSLFTQAIAKPKLPWSEMLLGLLIAFVFGAMHALQPGHGKTMVAAYLVGSRGTPRHAALLGVVVTITHTFGVFLLGFITLFASNYIVPEKLYPVLSAISGASICAVGIWLLYSRLRSLNGAPHDHEHTHEHPAHGHSHEHEHTHDHDHSHDHHSHTHAAAHIHPHPHPVSSIPVHAAHAHHHDAHDHVHDAPHSHTHDGHTHDHNGHTHEPHSHDDHSHEHNGHTHDHPHDHSHDEHTHEAHTHDHAHDHSHALGHSHDGQGYHTHDIPEGPITAKMLITLGISGGIVPCPEALVVLLAAIKLQRILYGMLLITAFSVGLASSLIAIGLVVVSARHRITRIPGSDTLLRYLPIGSAVVITIIGIALTINALALGRP